MERRSDLAEDDVPGDLSVLREQFEAADRLLGETARRLRLLSAQMDDLAKSQEAIKARMDHAQRVSHRR